MNSRRTCDQMEGDEKWIEEFEDALHMLTGMVEEAFVATPQYLLSPILRQSIRDKGRQVAEMHRKITRRIVVDNLGPQNLYGVEP